MIKEAKPKTGKLAFSAGLVDQVLTVVARHSDDTVTTETLLSRDRHEPVAIARQQAWWILRRHAEVKRGTTYSPVTLQTLGDAFGRDHGTVMIGIRAINNRMEVDARFRERTEAIEEECLR